MLLPYTAGCISTRPYQVLPSSPFSLPETANDRRFHDHNVRQRIVFCLDILLCSDAQSDPVIIVEVIFHRHRRAYSSRTASRGETGRPLKRAARFQSTNLPDAPKHPPLRLRLTVHKKADSASANHTQVIAAAMSTEASESFRHGLIPNCRPLRSIRPQQF